MSVKGNGGSKIRIGLYICHCGTNIAKMVDVVGLVEEFTSHPDVAVSKHYRFMCSEPGQELIIKDIKENNLDRVVVAACSPLMHEPTFRKAVERAGMNRYFFEMVNIREQVSWVSTDYAAATRKARALINGAIARVKLHEPLDMRRVQINQRVMVVGGGIGGIESALQLADAGFDVVMVEKEDTIGGHMAKFDKTFPTLDCAACILTPKMVSVGQHSKIRLLTWTEVENVEGYIGNFKIKVRKKARYVDPAVCNGCGACYDACPSLPVPSERKLIMGKDILNHGVALADAAAKLEKAKAAAAKPAAGVAMAVKGPGKVAITIDGKAAQVDDGMYLLDAVKEMGIDIPASCRYPFLEPRAVCKLCQVEIKDPATGQMKLVTSCDLKVKAGMEVQTHSAAAVEARKQALANLMSRTAPNHHFQTLADQMGVKAPFGDPVITCFRCMLCVRTCDELVGAKALSLKKVKEGSTTPVTLDAERCILCGACATVCPTNHIVMEDATNRKVMHHDLRLGPNAAITLTFRQAVPNVPRIHTEDCIHFNGGECGVCAAVCPKECIHYDDQDVIEEIEVGTVVMATGFQDFDPTPMKQFGYGKYPNVVSAIEFEQMNNAAGPTGGKILMENGKEPKSIAVLHCIGSRDEHQHKYCSRVCCMYALKFAHLIKEKTSAEVYQMYIDMRAFGKGYEEFYHRILEEGVNVIRGKAAEVVPTQSNHRAEGGLLVCCEDTLIGKYRQIPVDMVVLCTALEARADAGPVGRKFNISTGADGWYIEAHPKLGPVSTTTEGIFIAGVCQGAKDIPDTVAQGSAAAALAMKLMRQGEIMMDAAYAEINEDLCSGCKICNGLCPYNAISYEEGKKVSRVNPAMCKACGTCVAACPSGAIKGRHFTDEQIYAQIEGILA